MAAREIVPGVFSVGVIDWDRRMFDELIPLPDGTTYNSYLVQGGDATALIDTVDPAMTAGLMGNLDRLGVEKIDYIICNHAEQDHRARYPWCSTGSRVEGGDEREVSRSPDRPSPSL